MVLKSVHINFLYDEKEIFEWRIIIEIKKYVIFIPPSFVNSA
jgi:hypothetical protein